MTDYGVQPTGYVRKPLSVIISEVEAGLITEFGVGLIQTSQSPMGQIVGILSEAIAKLWELGEDTYQSYDPDQAEGIRLDTLGRLRLLNRGVNEQDTEYRQAITNSGQARVDLQDIIRALRGLDGVTYAQVFLDDPNVPPGSISVAIEGGDDDEIGSTMRQYIVPGISTFGNVTITTELEGFCRSMSIVRPILVPVELNIQIRTSRDKFGCAPPSTSAIRAGLLEDFALFNGQDVTWFNIRQLIETRFPNVEVVSVRGERNDIFQLPNTPVVIAFVERATISADDIFIEVVA